MTRIDVVTDHSGSGFIVAVDSSDRPPGAPYDWDSAATAVVVGQVHSGSQHIAGLWHRAGHYPPRGQHAETVKAASLAELAVALRKRHDEKGAWWQ